MSSHSRPSPRHAAGSRPERPDARVVEQMLRDNDQRLQCVIDLSFDCYWEQDENHRYTLLRYKNSSRPDGDPREFLGKTQWDLGGEPVHGTWDEHRALRDARLAFADLLILHRDSHLGERYFSVSGQPIIDAEGCFRGYRGIARDVSAERRHQRLLRLELEISRILDGEDADAALTAAIHAICESESWDLGLYWRLDDSDEVMQVCAGWSVEAERIDALMGRARALACGPGVGLAGTIWLTGEPPWVPDLRLDTHLERSLLPEHAGWNSALLCPVLSEGRMVGVLEFVASYIAKPDDRFSHVISALACRIGSYHSRALAVARLRESEERYSSTVELAAIGISHVALDGRFIHVNRRLCEMLGYVREELLGVTVREISHPDDVSATDKDLSRLRSGEIESITTEKRYLRKDGTPIWVRLTIASKRETGGQALYDISIVEDISDRRKAEERVQYLATHDEMTGLPNRAMFSQLLAQAIKQGRRYRRRFAVLFVDLDRFKVINDSLGHEAGDELLKVMAQRLRESLRSSDIVARLGGDEFVLLVEELADRQVAATIARNILSVIIRPVEILGQECRVTASIGISVYPEDAPDGKSLMKNADMAMYQAKEEGKNNYQFYSHEISALSVERLVIETHLRRAMERNELTLHYQAKVDFKTGEIRGVEALLRWSNQELGSVPPARFIPIAEDCGLIVPIGRWAMRTACVQCATWLVEGLPPVCMAINISPRQFQDPNLLADIAQMIEETEIPPALLEFEITESMIMHDLDKALENLRAMKGLGVRVAIDDFGTGYSSLSQLKRFPVDTLKVDRSFIRDIPGNTEDRAITEAIISMGKSLGVVVVAEGVETAEQQAFLSNRACDEMQGFYFSRPSPPGEFAELLRSHVPAPRE